MGGCAGKDVGAGIDVGVRGLGTLTVLLPRVQSPGEVLLAAD